MISIIELNRSCEEERIHNLPLFKFLRKVWAMSEKWEQWCHLDREKNRKKTFEVTRGVGVSEILTFFLLMEKILTSSWIYIELFPAKLCEDQEFRDMDGDGTFSEPPLYLQRHEIKCVEKKKSRLSNPRDQGRIYNIPLSAISSYLSCALNNTDVFVIWKCSHWMRNPNSKALRPSHLQKHNVKSTSVFRTEATQ